MLQKFGVLLIFIAFSISIQAQFHEDVFPGESGAELITKLRLEYKPLNVLSYGDAREVMYTDLYNENDSVTCVYSGHQLYLNPNSSDPIGDLIRGGAADGINCEHTFPQSKGAGSGNARSDMHHLFPARARVNEARLNYPYAEIDDRDTESWFYKDGQQSQIPSSNIDLYSELDDGEFEPREDHKGNVARAVFYFYAIYRSTADASFFSGMRETLCEWHYLDPVDQREWDNNITISTYQSDKRNPFILDCSLAERTFCPTTPSNCQFTSTSHVEEGISKVFPNPATDEIVIEWIPGVRPQKVELVNALGRTVQTVSVDEGARSTRVDVHELNAGIYFINIEDVDGRMLYKVVSVAINSPR